MEDYKVLSSAAIVALAALIKVVIDAFLQKRQKKDNEEVRADADRSIAKILEIRKDEQDDVFALMLRNVGELREYYTINKLQARRSFSTAIGCCIMGFIIFCVGFVMSNSKTDISKLSTFAGTLIEIISALFFWIYKKALDQLNFFHLSLLKTEKFLTAIKLIDKISEAKKDENYVYVIKAIVNSNVLADPLQLVNNKHTQNRKTRRNSKQEENSTAD